MLAVPFIHIEEVGLTSIVNTLPSDYKFVLKLMELIHLHGILPFKNHKPC